MPLLITLPAPMPTTAHLPVSSLYAIIDAVAYERRGLEAKKIRFKAVYYASEAACVANAAPLLLNSLPADGQQAASPEEANTLPIFDFLDALLKARIEAVLPVGATVVRVA